MERIYDDQSFNTRTAESKYPLTGAVPASMRYDIDRINAMGGDRDIQRYYSSTGGNFSPTNPVIRIDVASSNYLDLNSALLVFSITNSSAAAAVIRMDGGCVCVLERVRILSNGAVLESIEHYNLLHIALSQMTSNSQDIRACNILGGGVVASSNYDTTTASQIANAATVVVATPLSALGWFNSSTAKNLPLGCPFTLELTLCTANTAFQAATAVTYSVSNVYLQVPSIVAEPGYTENLKMLAATNLGHIQWTAQTAKSYFATLQGVAANQTISINDRSQSLNALITILRDNAATALCTTSSLTRKSIGIVSNWTYQVAGKLYPQQPCDVVLNSDTGTTFAQVCRIWSSMGRFNGGLIDATNWNGAVDVTAAQSVAMLGVSLATFEDGSLMSGINTASSGQPVNRRISTGAAIAALVYEATTFALCDIVFDLDIETGAVYSRI